MLTSFNSPKGYTSITSMSSSGDKKNGITQAEVLDASKDNIGILNKKVGAILDALDLVARSRTQEYAQAEAVRRARYSLRRAPSSISSSVDDVRPVNAPFSYTWQEDARRAFIMLRKGMPLAQLQAKARKQHAEISKWLAWAKDIPTDRRQVPQETLVTQIYRELHMTTVYVAILQLVDYRMRDNLSALNFPGLRWCSRLSGTQLLSALKVLATLELPLTFYYEEIDEDCKLMQDIVLARDEMGEWTRLWQSRHAAKGLDKKGVNGERDKHVKREGADK
jgi:hypothetical protein